MSSLRFFRTIRTGVVGLSAAAMTLASAGGAAAEDLDVEDFSYPSWDVSYQVEMDSEGRAQAEVTEELVAQFPDFDQNRGIIRSLPTRYQGAPAAPQNISVTDDAGADVPFDVEDEGGFRSILVGDDSFVHGEQTYVISYTVDDVMHAADEADEFYWDLIPSDREQDIEEVSAEIIMGPELTAALTGSSACYLGTPEDSQDCTLEASGAEEAVFTVPETTLPAGQGLTAAIGVESGTVTQPKEREPNFALDVLPLILVAAAALLAGGGTVAVIGMTRRRRQESGHSPAQYWIPEGINPLIAGPVLGVSQNPVVPTILDLAVRGVLRIQDQQGEQRWYRSKPKPTLQLLDPQLAADPLEIQLLEGLFPGLQPGSEFTFPTHDKTFTKAAQHTMRESRRAILDRGLMTRAGHRRAALAGAAALVLLLPAAILLVVGASRDNVATTVISIVLGLITVMLAVIAMVKHRVHTPEGAALRANLVRVRHMMKASEAERLELMQSFSTAGRTPNPSAGPQVIELYDRLLPYAVLFGLQKEWAAVLSATYSHYQAPAPVWYPALWGSGVQGMESSLTSLLSSVSSAAGTSSSGAGATGGGAVGGGGGGGAAGGR